MVHGIFVKFHQDSQPQRTFRGWGIYSSSTLEVAVRVGVSEFLRGGAENESHVGSMVYFRAIIWVNYNELTTSEPWKS